MFLIRESFQQDVDQILEVAAHLDTVNLPADRELLAAIVSRSEASFSGELEPRDREYLFVLEDLDAGRIIGTSVIHAQHGTRRSPHIFFQIIEEERYSESLDRYMVHQCLRLGYNYDGPTEIGGLILLPEYRGHPERLGTLLSYTRFLFIAMHRTVFRDQVLSELLPPLEPGGASKLWDHLGRQFTGLSYQEADRLSKNNKEFIRALFPHGLIYTSLLPADVREVIGQVGPETKGVEKILRRIGFRYANQIDPFDGGPHFRAATDDITLVKKARQTRIAAAPARGPGEDGTPSTAPFAIVASEKGERPRFRATGVRADIAAAGEMRLGEQTCSLLGVEPGENVWAVVL